MFAATHVLPAWPFVLMLALALGVVVALVLPSDR